MVAPISPTKEKDLVSMISLGSLPPGNQALKMVLMKMEVDSVFKTNPGRTMDANSIANLVPPASEDLRVPAHK